MNALILVDIQNDFLPGGALAVPGGDQVVDVANEAMGRFDRVVATQDWHPADHGSFATEHPGRKVYETILLDGVQQTLWPRHCVQRSAGASFASALRVAGIDHVIQKGTDRRVDSYSGFFDNARGRATGLQAWLKSHDVNEVSVMGLALDYCVALTAIDAVELGFQTTVWTDGCRGVENTAGDCDAAIDRLRSAGVVVR